MFVNVYTDIGKSRPVILKAKVIQREGTNYKIRYLSPTDEKYNGKTLFKYEPDEYIVDEESITECIDDNDEECIGYKVVPEYGGFIEEDTDETDSDYNPSCTDVDTESESMYEENSEMSEQEVDEYYNSCDDENFQDYE